MAIATDECSEKVKSWPDLPIELLTIIADRLGIIELFSFRGTCKDFRSSSSNASAEIECSRDPWLLLPKTDSPECIVYNEHESKTYKRNIPELEDAICLASSQGWLLLFKNESIFFFCPFSLTKIALPVFPHKQVDGHVAAFSNVPTSPECVVSVINIIDNLHVEINMISKGETSWAQHKIPGYLRSTLTAATFIHSKQKFYYMDDEKFMLTFTVKDKKSKPYRIVEQSDQTDQTEYLPYHYNRHKLDEIVKKRHEFDLKDDEYVAVCGLTYKVEKSRIKHHVRLNEIVDASPTKTCIRRAVWIQPRFHKAHSNQHW